jgi:hypothetical protein
VLNQAEGKRTSDGADCIFCELVMARVENGTQAPPGSAKFEFRLAFDAFKPSGKWTELLFHGSERSQMKGHGLKRLTRSNQSDGTMNR